MQGLGRHSQFGIFFTYRDGVLDLRLFRGFLDQVSHMGKPNRARYRQTEARVSIKVHHEESIKPEMNAATALEVGEIVARSVRFPPIYKLECFPCHI